MDIQPRRLPRADLTIAVIVTATMVVAAVTTGPPQPLARAGSAVVALGLLAPSVSRRLIEEYVRRRPGRPVPGAQSLTTRETQVWRLITAGRSNAEIAAELFLGEAAVKTHVSRLMAKLGARDRIQLVVLGFDGGPAGGD